MQGKKENLNSQVFIGINIYRMVGLVFKN
jgi:hypothetical protein